MEPKPKTVADNLVVSLLYELSVDGEMVDIAEADDPLEYIQGSGSIIPGLESALYGMAIGESKRVKVSAKDGYGDRDPEANMTVPRKEFPKEIPLELGTVLQVEDEEGEILDATIIAISKEKIELDLNHPLAGKDLSFKVTIHDLRPATAEELEHGHVHYEDEDLDEDFEDFEEDEHNN